MKEEELRQLEEKLNAREKVYLCDDFFLGGGGGLVSRHIYPVYFLFSLPLVE